MKKTTPLWLLLLVVSLLVTSRGHADAAERQPSQQSSGLDRVEPRVNPVDPVVLAGQPASLRPWIWSSLAATVASGATAGVLWYLAEASERKYEDARDRRQDWAGPPEGEAWDELVRREKETHEDAALYDGLALGVSLGAGAFLLTTSVLWIVDHRRSFTEEPGIVQMSFYPGGLELTF